MKIDDYKEKLNQINKAIEANEMIDVDTTILYALKHEYEETIRELETKEESKEVEEMSPFCDSNSRTVKFCYEACSKEQTSDSVMGYCHGCEHGCQFIHDYKGNFLINHKDYDIWIKIKKEDACNTQNHKGGSL